MCKHLKLWVAGVALLSLVGLEARAGNVFWVVDADGNWAQASNWSSNPLLPGSGDDVTIDVAGNRLITLASGQSIQSLHSNERIDVSGAADLVLGTTAQVGGTLRLLGNAGLVGGAYTMTGGAQLLVASGRLEGVAFSGDVALPYQNSVLTVRNGLMLNGTVHVNGTGQPVIAFPGSQAVSGNATFAFESADGSAAYFALNGVDTTLTLGSGVLVRGGNAWIGANLLAEDGVRTLANQGVISADVAGQSLEVNGQSRLLSVNNSGTLRAANGGTLNVAVASLVNSGTVESSGAGSLANVVGSEWNSSGTIRATGGGALYLGGGFTLGPSSVLDTAGGKVGITGTLHDSTLALNAATGSWGLTGGAIRHSTINLSQGMTLNVAQNGNNLLEAVTVNGDLDLSAPGASLRVVGGMTLDGRARVSGDQAVLAFEGAQTVMGNATIALGAVGGASFLSIGGVDSTLTLGAGVRVQGGRSFIGFTSQLSDGARTLNNQGEISADVAGEEMSVGSNKPLFVSNAGTLQATNGSTLTLGTSGLTNAGTIQALAGGILNFRSSTQTSSGTLRADNGTIQVLDGDRLVTSPGSTTLLAGDSGRLILGRGFDNGGSFNWTGGYIIGLGGDFGVSTSNGVFNNLAGGTFTVSAAGGFGNAQITSGNAFNNAGSFSKTGSSITIFDVPFTNLAGASVTVDAGTLVLAGGGENRGTITVNKGATARFSQGFTHAAGSTLIATGDVAFETAVYELAGNLFIDGELSFNSATATVRAGASATKLALVNSTAAVAAGGQLSVGSGGINFNGDALSTVTLQPSATTPGRLMLNGNVSFTGLAGRGELNTADVATGQTPGVLDLGGVARTFSVNDGSADLDLRVSARTMNGSIIKMGLGTMRLDGPNAGLASVTVTSGTLEATDPGALGQGIVTVGDATLALRSDAATPGTFAGEVKVTGDGTIRVDRIAIGNVGIMKVGSVSLGATRLTVAGANGRSLEVGSLSIQGATTLDVQAPLTINGMVTEAQPGSGFTKSGGTSTLTLAGTTANTSTGPTRVNAGTLELKKPAGVIAVAGDFSVFGGTARLFGDGQIASTSNVIVANATSVLDLNGHSNTVASLALTGAMVKMGASGSGGMGSALLRVNGTLSITGGGRLDLGDNQLIVDYADSGASPAAIVKAALSSAYAGGNWTGPGIASAGAGSGRSLGYAEASEVLGSTGGIFGGQQVDGSTVLARYTLDGDATLDGVVDFNDLVKLAQNYNAPASGGSTWYRGDFNYDGMVDFNDLVKLAQNYNRSVLPGTVTGSVGFEEDVARAFSAAATPEPGVWGTVGLGLVWSVGRRPGRTAGKPAR